VTQRGVVDRVRNNLRDLVRGRPLELAACAVAVSALVACATRSLAPVPSAPLPAPAPPVAPLPAPPAGTLVSSSPAQAGFAPTLISTLDSIITAAIADSTAPAMALAVGRWGRLVHLRGYGHLTYDPASPAVDEHTRFDMASLTKVIATTTAAMMLEDQGKLDIDRTVASYLPELDRPDKRNITVRMLLTHSGGFEAYAPLWHTTRGRAAYLQAIATRPLAYTPGTRSVYSDWDFILMQLIIERITGQTLDAYTAQHIFQPLGMTETGFRPDLSLRPHIAPTEIDTARGGLMWGVVHDENAWAMGGVAGHAGLFASARDLAVFAQMMLQGGSYGPVRLIAPTTVARWTARQSTLSSRALGWDTPSDHSSAGHYFSPRSYGHTGFTGTSIWTDPERGVWIVLLTNRVYPTRKNEKHIILRREIADAVQRAITDAPLINWQAERAAAPTQNPSAR